MNCVIRLKFQSSISINEVTTALGAKPNLHLNLAPFLIKTVNFFCRLFIAFNEFFVKTFCQKNQK